MTPPDKPSALTTDAAGAALPKILLVDDDLVFGRMMEKAAYYRGANLVYCRTVHEMMKRGSLGQYDIVLLDYHIGAIKGSTLAAFAHFFFGRTPVIIVSASSEWWFKSRDRYPGSVRGFIQKDDSIGQILLTAMATAAEHRDAMASGEYADQCDQPYPNWRFVYDLYRKSMALCGQLIMSGVGFLALRKAKGLTLGPPNPQ